MFIKLQVPCDWEGVRLPQGTRLSFPDRIAVELIAKKNAVPVVPPVSVQVMQPGEKR